jgi:hypothetical protein
MSLGVDLVLMNAESDGESLPIDIVCGSRYLAFYVIGSVGAAGQVEFYEADSVDQIADWDRLGPPIDIRANGLRVYRPDPGAYRALKVVIPNPLAAGTVTVKLQGNKEP